MIKNTKPINTVETANKDSGTNDDEDYSGLKPLDISKKKLRKSFRENLGGVSTVRIVDEIVERNWPRIPLNWRLMIPYPIQNSLILNFWQWKWVIVLNIVIWYSLNEDNRHSFNHHQILFSRITLSKILVLFDSYPYFDWKLSKRETARNMTSTNLPKQDWFYHGIRPKSHPDKTSRKSLTNS